MHLHRTRTPLSHGVYCRRVSHRELASATQTRLSVSQPDREGGRGYSALCVPHCTHQGHMALTQSELVFFFLPSSHRPCVSPCLCVLYQSPLWCIE